MEELNSRLGFFNHSENSLNSILVTYCFYIAHCIESMTESCKYSGNNLTCGSYVLSTDIGTDCAEML